MSTYTLDDVAFISKGLDALVQDAYAMTDAILNAFGEDVHEKVMKVIAVADILSELVDNAGGNSNPNFIVDSRLGQFREIGVIR